MLCARAHGAWGIPFEGTQAVVSKDAYISATRCAIVVMTGFSNSLGRIPCPNAAKASKTIPGLPTKVEEFPFGGDTDGIRPPPRQA
jgi:hypothetical protein